MEVDKTYRDTLQCQLSTLTCSDGSAEFTNNNTSVIVSVNGPMEVKMNKEDIEKATIELLYKHKSGLPSVAQRAMESHLKSACENVILTNEHPRSSVTVVVQEVHDNGSLLAACINALSLALLDASVPMSCMISASSCVLNYDGAFQLHPDKEQESEAKAEFTFVFETEKWEVMTSHCKGRFTKKDYTEALAKCREEGTMISSFMETMVEKKFAKYKL